LSSTRSSKLFFDIEKAICEDTVVALNRRVTEIDDLLVQLQAKLNDCNKAKGAFVAKNVPGMSICFSLSPSVSSITLFLSLSLSLSLSLHSESEEQGRHSLA
jgi:hypothetical protein